jgi:putative photosynthetic complex assembly protein
VNAHAAPAQPADPIGRRGLLLAAIAAASLAGVAAARLGGWQAASPDAPTVQQRRLHFLDRPDGGIAVVDADSGSTLDVVQGEQGFLRGVLRSMARERRRQDQGPRTPLELHGRSDGRLTLLDPATGRRIDLESFGPTNAAVFARWLGSPAPAARAATTTQGTP